MRATATVPGTVEKVATPVAKIALALIASLFVWKYGARITPGSHWIGLLYFSVACGLLLTRVAAGRTVGRYLIYGSLGLGIGLVALALAVTFLVPLSSLNVDRWSVIASFVAQLEAGDYPYFATSHMGNPPGPMPFYFLVAYPFLKLGLLSLLSAAGYLYLLWLGRRGKIADRALNGLLLIVLSPVAGWEIATRSNILTYSVLCLLAVRSFGGIDFRRPLDRRALGSAVFAGLVLSTRSIYIIPYLVFGLSELIGQLRTSGTAAAKRLLAYGTVAALAFGLTFLPLLLIWPQSFRAMNPFVVQSEYLMPSAYIYGVLALTVVAIFLTARQPAPVRYFFSGLFLLGMIAAYALYQLVVNGWREALFGSAVDLSYFVFCVPFLVYYLVNGRSDLRDLPTLMAKA